MVWPRVDVTVLFSCSRMSCVQLDNIKNILACLCLQHVAEEAEQRELHKAEACLLWVSSTSNPRACFKEWLVQY